MCGVMLDVCGMSETTCFGYRRGCCAIDCCLPLLLPRFFLLTHATTTPVKPSPQQLYLGVPLIVNSVAAMH